MAEVFVSSEDVSSNVSLLENATYDSITLLAIYATRVGSYLIFSFVLLPISRVLMIHDLIDHRGTTSLIALVCSIILLV